MAQKRRKTSKHASNRGATDADARPLRPNRGFVPGNPGNSGGKKGRSGRHPKAFKAFMQRLSTGKNAKKAMRKVMRAGATHPFFPFVMKLATEYGYGKPQQHVDVTSKGKALEDLVGAANASTEEE